MSPTEVEIWDMMNAAEARMSVDQQRLWEWVRILPERWQQHPYGDPEGFWAVGLLGRVVIWQYGIIGDYWCNQDELELAVQHLLTAIETGYDAGGFCGPPQSIR